MYILHHFDTHLVCSIQASISSPNVINWKQEEHAIIILYNGKKFGKAKIRDYQRSVDMNRTIISKQ